MAKNCKTHDECSKDQFCLLEKRSCLPCKEFGKWQDNQDSEKKRSKRKVDFSDIIDERVTAQDEIKKKRNGSNKKEKLKRKIGKRLKKAKKSGRSLIVDGKTKAGSRKPCQG